MTQLGRIKSIHDDILQLSDTDMTKNFPLGWRLHWYFFKYSYFKFNPSRPSPVRRDKIKLNFIFTLLYYASKGFMKAFKAFIKPLEALEKSVKMKI